MKTPITRFVNLWLFDQGYTPLFSTCAAGDPTSKYCQRMEKTHGRAVAKIGGNCGRERDAEGWTLTLKLCVHRNLTDPHEKRDAESLNNKAGTSASALCGETELRV